MISKLTTESLSSFSPSGQRTPNFCQALFTSYDIIKKSVMPAPKQYRKEAGRRARGEPNTVVLKLFEIACHLMFF